MKRLLFLATCFAAAVFVSGRPKINVQSADKQTSRTTAPSIPNGASVRLLGSTRKTIQKTSTPPQRPIMGFPTTYPKRTGCFYEGKWYRPGLEISRGYDGKSWCYGTYCDQSGNVVQWDHFNCKTSSTTMPHLSTTIPGRPTTAPPSPTPVGCYFNGEWFSSNTEISRGSSYGWCYGTFCDAEGNILAWDNWTCSTTSEPNTTPYPTTLTTTPRFPRRADVCFFQDVFYGLGSTIYPKTWIGDARCYGKRCSNGGQIITWLDYDCKEDVETVQNTFKANGCWYEGHFYHQGVEIFREHTSGRCYEGICRNNGLQNWKSLDCNKLNRFLLGYGRSHTCSYGGQLFPRGAIVHSKSLYKSHGFGWCIGAKCAKNGRIVAWGPKWSPGYC